MFLVVFLGILTVVMLVLSGMVIGGFIFVPEEIRGSFSRQDFILVTVYAVCLLLLGGTFFLSVRDHIVAHTNFPSSEYQIGKKVIISSVGDCTDKADTLYFFVKKSNN